MSFWAGPSARSRARFGSTPDLGFGHNAGSKETGMRACQFGFVFLCGPFDRVFAEVGPNRIQETRPLRRLKGLCCILRKCRRFRLAQVSLAQARSRQGLSLGLQRIV